MTITVARLTTSLLRQRPKHPCQWFLLNCKFHSVAREIIFPTTRILLLRSVGSARVEHSVFRELLALFSIGPMSISFFRLTYSTVLPAEFHARRIDQELTHGRNVQRLCRNRLR